MSKLEMPVKIYGLDEIGAELFQLDMEAYACNVLHQFNEWLERI